MPDVKLYNRPSISLFGKKDSLTLRGKQDLTLHTLWAGPTLAGGEEMPVPALIETWQFIDANIWAVTNPATGTAWQNVVGSTPLILAGSIPNLSETASIRTKDYWVIPAFTSANSVYAKFTLEFEMRLTNLANIDETATFFGIGAANATRVSNDIIGFAVLADVLQTVSKVAAVETNNTAFGETLTDVNKFKIVIIPGHCRFYLQGVEIADHTTITNDRAQVVKFHHVANATGASGIYLGQIRMWNE